MDEKLSCQCEPGNIEDPHAVALLKNDVVLGHVPRNLTRCDQCF